MSEELKLDEDDLGTILAIGNNEQSGRVTNFELKELVRVYRQYSAIQARLSEAVKVLEETIPLLVDAADKLEAEGMWGTSERDMAIRARQFLATIGKET